eukprot:CAMPEP_0203634332 /NCGR_PEP_ID=MMETSP0088-20131115/1333_1 /ASSEMBLY_ACC=CAM_ASM_001087 /TAXON_ID=426623 /ORGANISM="Chaetoceros affinis, Strain CCMP159" /LENGTH=202 /DNA_ID=CAMNT_0050487937 /DNA_START=23 /DNA_END=632 /DNA_ORIENTATION=-
MVLTINDKVSVGRNARFHILSAERSRRRSVVLIRWNIDVCVCMCHTKAVFRCSIHPSTHQFPNLNGDTQDTSNFDLYEYLGNNNESWGIIFMHPGDYTPVCTTELGMAASKKADFDARNVKMCGFSCNSAESHRGWVEDIKAATGYDVDFPLFCDPGGYRVIDLPSEKGKELTKHYLRYTKDPSKPKRGGGLFSMFSKKEKK